MDLIEGGEPAKPRDFCRELVAEDGTMTSAHVLLGDEDLLGDTDAALASYERRRPSDRRTARCGPRSRRFGSRGTWPKPRFSWKAPEGQKAVVDSRIFAAAMSSA